MKFTSLEPFIPSGRDFEGAKELFAAVGFTLTWDAGDYVGFQKDECRFILQRFNNRKFAENLMISVQVSDIQEFWKLVNENDIANKYGVRFSAPAKVPYGTEVNLIDKAGVCWHFVES